MIDLGRGKDIGLSLEMRALNKLLPNHPAFVAKCLAKITDAMDQGTQMYISRVGDWNRWIAFFLQAITVQSKNHNAKVKAIMGLYDDMKEKIHEITHSQYTVHLVDAIFDRPIFDSFHLLKHADIPVASVKSFIPKLEKAGILTEIRPARGRTPAILAFGQLLNITERKNVF